MKRIVETDFLLLHENMSEKYTYNELEQKFLEANNRTLEVEKLINAFLSNISHEIRTPLNSILGFAELLREPDLEEEEREEYFDYIDTKCNYLLNFVDNVIDLARIESRELKLSRTMVDINSIMADMNDKFLLELKKYGKEHIKLIHNKTQSIQELVIFTDESRVRQVITNLISNAIKFTNKGFIEFGYQIKNLETVIFYVKDTGIGLPEDRKNEIFDKFKVINVALSKKIGGAGLGLTISQQLVKLLGGNLWHESVEGEGSTFYFSIPIKSSEEAPVEPINNKHRNTFNWQEKTIIVAEDVEMNFMFIEAALKKTRAKVLWARDGEEAIELIKQNVNGKSHIDLVIMDIQMPEINGYEATKKIKEINNTIPVLSHTAFEFEEELEKSLQAGCDDYLPKPVTPDVLITKLSRFLEKGVN